MVRLLATYDYMARDPFAWPFVAVVLALVVALHEFGWYAKRARDERRQLCEQLTVARRCARRALAGWGATVAQRRAMAGNVRTLGVR